MSFIIGSLQPTRFPWASKYPLAFRHSAFPRATINSMATKARVGFIEPMLLVRTNTLPEGASWRYEVKLDGYRAIAIKANGHVRLRSRNDNDFTARYPAITKALESLPDGTVIDGEVVALDVSCSILSTPRKALRKWQNLLPLVKRVFWGQQQVDAEGTRHTSSRDAVSETVTPKAVFPTRAHRALGLPPPWPGHTPGPL
jgi:hypothetical protein